MRREYLAVFSILVIAAACFAGCTTGSGNTATATAATGSTGTSDRDIMLQGITSGDQYCMDHLSAGASTDKCHVTTTNRELIVTQIIAASKEHEQECLAEISQSTDPSVCTVSSATKQAVAERSAICIDNMGNNNVAGVKECVNTAFAALT